MRVRVGLYMYCAWVCAWLSSVRVWTTVAHVGGGRRANRGKGVWQQYGGSV